MDIVRTIDTHVSEHRNSKKVKKTSQSQLH